MKRILLILLFAILSLQTQESNFPVIYLPVSSPLRPYDRLLEAIIQIESGGNRYAVGDKHLKKHSYGLLQIRQSRLDDYNRRTGEHYSVVDLFDVEVSKRIFFWYCQGDYEVVAKSWNGSGPKTEIYWRKVQKCLDNLN